MLDRALTFRAVWFLGYALLWSCRLVATFNYPLFGIEAHGPSANNSLNITMQISYFIAMLAVGVLSLKHEQIANSRPVITCGLTLSAGMALAAIAAYATEPARTPLLILAGIIAGIGDAGLSLMWDRKFSEGSPDDARKQISVGLAAGAILYFAIAFMFPPLAFVVTAFLPIASALLLKQKGDTDLRASWPPDRKRCEASFYSLAPALLCTAICSIAFGMVGQVALTVPFQRGLEHLLTPMSAASAGLIACILAFAIKHKMTFDTVYIGIFSIVSIGLFLLPLLGSNYAIILNGFVGPAYYLATAFYLYYAVDIVQRQQVPAYAIYGISRGIFCGTTLIAVLLSVSLYLRDNQFGTVQLLLISFVSAYLLAMGLLIIYKRRNGNKMPPEQKKTAPRDYPAEFSKAHHFTQRESEIFSLLIAGRTHTYIAETLCLSPSTVKGYIQNIYRKCDVHGRQELIDSYEKWLELSPP